MKKCLRKKERLATIVDCKVRATPAGGRVACVWFELDDESTLDDRFHVYGHWAGSEAERVRELGRHRSFCTAVANGQPEASPIGRQVIIILDGQGNAKSYRPALIRLEGPETAQDAS